jgi:hypothetical protein
MWVEALIPYTDEKTHNNRGNHDYWLVKLDDNKQIQWDKTIAVIVFDNLQALHKPLTRV